MTIQPHSLSGSLATMLLCVTVGCLAVGCSGSPPPQPGSSNTTASSLEASPQRAASPQKADLENAAAEAAPTESAADPATAVSVAQPGNVEEISFDDVNLGLQPDIAFRPFMLNDRVRELDGKRVRIAGYMLPDVTTEGIEQFVLLRNTECKFGPGGQPDHLLSVTMRSNVITKFSAKPIEVEGTLKIEPFMSDGITWYIYELNDADGIRSVRR